MSLGVGVFNQKSTKQKLYTKSSTETEVVGASDYLPYTIWTKRFLEAPFDRFAEYPLHKPINNFVCMRPAHLEPVGGQLQVFSRWGENRHGGNFCCVFPKVTPKFAQEKLLQDCPSIREKLINQEAPDCRSDEQENNGDPLNPGCIEEQHW